MKVIALIDKPKSCASCPFVNDGYAFNMCNLSKRQITTVDIPDWCELRPLPQKKEETFAYWIARGCNDPESYINGWNACLDEVVGYCLEDEREDEEE